MKKLFGMLCLILLNHGAIAAGSSDLLRTGDDAIPIASPKATTPTPDNPTLNPNSSYTSLQDVLIPSNQPSASPDQHDRMEELPLQKDLRAKIKREHRNQKIVGVFCGAVAIACTVYASVEGHRDGGSTFDLRSCVVGAGLSFFAVPFLFLCAHMLS